MKTNKLRIALAIVAVLTTFAAILSYIVVGPASEMPKASDLELPDFAASETETQISTFLEAEMLAWKKERVTETTLPAETTSPETTEKPEEQTTTESPTEAVVLNLKRLVSLASDPPPEPPPPAATEAATAAPQPTTTTPPDDTKPELPTESTLSGDNKPNGEVLPSGSVADPYEYFGNIIMLGDSMTTGFDLYRNSIKFEGKDVLRDLTVVAVVSYGVNNALREISNNSIHPLFMGKQTKPEDIIAQKKAKYVFICLGINDIIWQQTENFIKSYATLVNNIREKSPEKIIVIMSLTPVVAGTHEGGLNNDRIMEANAALLRFANDNGIPFIDYAAALRDAQNSLPRELSSDGYCHFTIAAYNKLVEYMLNHPVY